MCPPPLWGSLRKQSSYSRTHQLGGSSHSLGSIHPGRDCYRPQARFEPGPECSLGAGAEAYDLASWGVDPSKWWDGGCSLGFHLNNPNSLYKGYAQQDDTPFRAWQASPQLRRAFNEIQWDAKGSELEHSRRIGISTIGHSMQLQPIQTREAPWTAGRWATAGTSTVTRPGRAKLRASGRRKRTGPISGDLRRFLGSVF